MTAPDPEAIVAGAELPEALGALVLETVRAARLWRREQADVADELVGHFRDGLARGAAPADLAAAFGSPATAARLIRRAKRRARPVAWRVARGAGACAVFLGVFYAVIAIRFFTGSPTISRDYLAELNQGALAVPAAERAWPLYRQAALGLRDMPQDLDLQARPGAAGWDAVAAYVAARQDALAQGGAAARRPGLGFVMGYGISEEDRALWPEVAASGTSGVANRGLMFLLLPQLRELQGLGRLLAIDALAAAERGDGAAAAAGVGAILGIATHAGEAPVLICDLVAFKQIGLATRTLGEILDRRPEVLTDAQLHELARSFSSVRGGGRLVTRFDSEEAFFRDLLQRLYTDDGAGDGRITAAGLRAVQGFAAISSGGEVTVGPLAPAWCSLVAGRKAMTLEFDRLMGLLEAQRALPLWAQDHSNLDAEVQALNASQVRRVRYLPIALLMPAVGHAVRIGELATMDRDAALVVIALELHRRRAGAHPATLTDLVPDLLPAIPPDRYDGKPLRYRLDEEGRPLLYSVGKDRTDEGGEPSADTILWPPP